MRDTGWGLLLWGLDGVVAGSGRAPGDGSRTQRTVLVVRLDAIGDFVLWSGAARALRALYPPPDHRLVLVANGLWAELARGLGCFDDVVPLDRRRFLRSIRYRRSRLRAVRRLGADVCVQPTFSREFLFGDAVVRASGAPERIGSEGDCSNLRGWQKAVSDRWYTRLVSANPAQLPELERNVEFLRALGLGSFEAKIPALEPPGAPPRDFRAADYYVLFVGASSPLKRWPVERLAEVAGRIHARTGWVGVVCGGPGDEPAARRLLEAASVPLENWVGRTTLPELCHVVRGASLVVTNDTAAVHVAAAVSTPAVCVLGGGHFGRFLPYRVAETPGGPAPVAVFREMPCFHCNWRCVHGVGEGEAAPCVAAVTADDVWAAVQEALGTEGAAAPAKGAGG